MSYVPLYAKSVTLSDIQQLVFPRDAVRHFRLHFQ